jgi:hypothetical protein
MSTAWRILILTVLAALLALPLAGCQKAAEELTEKATGVDVEQDDDSVTVTTEDEDGDSVTITGGEDLDVPDSYPDDFPLYKGEVTGSSSLTTGDGSMVTVAVGTDDSLETIRAFFEEEFGNEGWNVVFTNEMTEGGVTTVNYAVEKSGRNATVAISSEDGQTTVTHTVVAAE